MIPLIVLGKMGFNKNMYTKVYSLLGEKINLDYLKFLIISDSLLQ